MLAASDFVQWLDRAPALGIGVLAVLGLIGLVLWVFGGRLARPATIIGGVVLGALAGAAGLGGSSLWWVIALAGALVGGLLAGLLYRVWMALAMALILALATAGAVLIWRGAPLPPLHGIQAVAQEVGSATTRPAPASRTGTRLAKILERENQAVVQWWKDLKPAGQHRLVLWVAGAALAGAVVGFILPNLSTMIQSALVGGLLLLMAVRGLLVIAIPQAMDRVRAGPRVWLVLLGLITVVGLLIQWARRPRKADKSPQA